MLTSSELPTGCKVGLLKQVVLTVMLSASAASVAHASPFEDAIKLYDQEKFDQALVAVRDALRDPELPARDRERATFFLGKTLYNLKAYEQSLAAFATIAEAGAGHPYRGKTLQWLCALDHFLRTKPEDSKVLPVMARYTAEEFVLQKPIEPVLDEELSRVEAYLIAKGEATRAAAYGAVRVPKAKYQLKKRAK
jgi:hypothetical protein